MKWELEKTCSAIQAIEQNLIESNNGLFLRAVQTTEGIDDLILIKLYNNYGPGLDGAVILTRGKNINE